MIRLVQSMTYHVVGSRQYGVSNIQPSETIFSRMFLEFFPSKMFFLENCINIFILIVNSMFFERTVLYIYYCKTFLGTSTFYQIKSKFWP